MDLQEIYKKESGYDVGRYKIDNTNYYSEDYVEWLEKKLRIYDVVERSEQFFAFTDWYFEKEIAEALRPEFEYWLKNKGK